MFLRSHIIQTFLVHVISGGCHKILFIYFVFVFKTLLCEPLGCFNLVKVEQTVICNDETVVRT